ncbi:E3 ubiquitin-protein ligase MARCH3-like isoform X2 [Cynoglossus semilaevis]|uniref:E3 ubiquitin-protein ligase MARCH3-like isoform X2 n=2 Tax=Cynoglossus semilaevis TaxID=244447 RepID=UPI000D62D708|nr:E3 ubiquitin-protein ligase MARCH3-like isoform X2 [Cynoglossus semilaevis]
MDLYMYLCQPSESMCGLSDQVCLLVDPTEQRGEPVSGQPQVWTKMDGQLISTGTDIQTQQCDVQEELLTPCQCSGSLATVHRSCLEHWLSSSGTTFCELCHQHFIVQKKSRMQMEWMERPEVRRGKPSLFGDMVCFLFITLLATASVWLCLRGAMDYLYMTSRLEALGLIALTVALFTIYLFWTLVSLRHRCRMYNEWRQSKQTVIILARLHNEQSAIGPSQGPPHGKQPLLGSPV